MAKNGNGNGNGKHAENGDGEGKRKPGRPPIVFDAKKLEQLVTLAKINCTNAEIAAVMQVSEDTLSRHYADVIKNAREDGKSSLRRAQFREALKGNPTMLIWLGKNLLDQKDKTEVWTGDLTKLSDEELDDMEKRAKGGYRR